MTGDRPCCPRCGRAGAEQLCEACTEAVAAGLESAAGLPAGGRDPEVVRREIRCRRAGAAFLLHAGGRPRPSERTFIVNRSSRRKSEGSDLKPDPLAWPRELAQCSCRTRSFNPDDHRAGCRYPATQRTNPEHQPW